jgi:DNA-binding PadR family transcriptional regulator
MRQTPSLLEAALLGLLARQPASGYELRKIFQTTPLATYSDSPGAVYPALRRLRDRGFVSSAPATGGRQRTAFRLTSKGRVWLRRWIAQPVRQLDGAHTLAAMDLRLALISLIMPGRLVSFLRESARAVEAYRTSVARSLTELQDALLPSSRLALELGLHLLHARHAWYRQAGKGVSR